MVTAAIDLGYYFKKQQKASATTLPPNPTLETKYWMYAPGENASKWSRCKEQSIICIGWDEMGDLSQINTLSECRDGLRDVYENPDSSFMNDGLAIWEFSHVMQNGDIIYAKRGLSNIIARGIVKSEYIYDQSQEDFCHTRKVEWTHIGEWTLENIVLKTLTDITKYPDYVTKIEAMITEGKNNNKQSTQYDEKYSYYIKLLLKNKNLILNGAPGTGKTYLAKQIAAQIIFDGNVPEDFEENEMFINQYGFVQFHPSYDYTDFVEGLRPTPPNKNGNIGFERKDGIFKAFCRNAISTSSSQIVSTFQSIYDSIVKDIEVGAITSYQNRQGQNCPLRVNDKGRIEYRASENSPRTEKEENIKLFYDYFIKNNIYDISSYERDDYWNLIAELSNGSTNKVDYIEYGWILQELLNRTHKVFKESITEIKPYIFIIDEVNRGEISKIFGELFFAIDPGYRGKKGKVQTQYQNLITDESDPFKDGFYIPENVYIIGTMNDIDRSVECMDFAMRRRFTFKEITAEESAKNMGVDPDRMKRLNNAISGIEGFNSSFHIGAAYFRGVTDYEELWELKLQGLLKEYLRGMPDAEENLNTLKKAYFKTEE
jgi:Cdc6-like AAA superfamily ATPase